MKWSTCKDKRDDFNSFIVTNDREGRDRVAITICGRIELAVVWILPLQ